MSENDEYASQVAAFGYCTTCALPRTAVVEDEELVLLCANGHRSD
jgi:hypothetical protein